MKPENVHLFNNQKLLIDIAMEIKEHIEYLSYDVNPIGSQNDIMGDAMRTEIANEIKIIREKLNQLEHIFIIDATK